MDTQTYTDPSEGIQKTKTGKQWEGAENKAKRLNEQEQDKKLKSAVWRGRA